MFPSDNNYSYDNQQSLPTPLELADFNDLDEYFSGTCVWPTNDIDNNLNLTEQNFEFDFLSVPDSVDLQYHQTAPTSGWEVSIGDLSSLLEPEMFPVAPSKTAVFKVSVLTKTCRGGAGVLSNYSPEKIAKCRTLRVELPADCPVCVVKFTCTPVPGSPSGELYLSLPRTSAKIKEEVILVPHNGGVGKIERDLVRAKRNEISGHGNYNVRISVTINNIPHLLHEFTVEALKDHKSETTKGGLLRNATNASILQCSVSYS